MVRISQEILKSWDILRISQDLDIPGLSSSASLCGGSPGGSFLDEIMNCVKIFLVRPSVRHIFRKSET